MRYSYVGGSLLVGFALSAGYAAAATVVLYNQGFESPQHYVNNGGDVNIFTSVNENYGGQPPGFSFAQAFTVETLNVSGSARGGGSAAFGTGYSDPTGQGGNFALGMLSDFENDLLGLSFNVGAFPFFNVGIDVSSIDLSTFSGPFIPAGGLAPTFQFTLFDNPSGGNTTGSGTVLDQKTLTGTASEPTVFDWTSGILALSTAGNTSGDVTLQIDLLSGEYAAFDNLRITASDTPAPVPLPASLPLLMLGSGLLWAVRRRGR
jgi:hypothetical protein